MSIEIRAQLLDTIRKERLGIRETAKRFRKRPQAIISLIKEMENEGLLETYSDETRSRGRPKKMLKQTVLGEDYLETFRRLKLKTLRANRNDLLKAKKDAEYVNRLIVRGKNPYQAFTELNDLVRASRDSA
jgi:DNA-binding PadR family transcriptional regulator